MRIASVTRVAAGVSEWLPLDQYTDSGPADGIFTEVTGTVAYGLEVTPDDIFDPVAKAAAVAFPLPAPFAPGVTGNAVGVLPFAAKAIRINMATGTGTVVLKVAVRGLQ